MARKIYPWHRFVAYEVYFRAQTYFHRYRQRCCTPSRTATMYSLSVVSRVFLNAMKLVEASDTWKMSVALRSLCNRCLLRGARPYVSMERIRHVIGIAKIISRFSCSQNVRPTSYIFRASVLLCLNKNMMLCALRLYEKKEDSYKHLVLMQINFTSV